MLYTERDRVSVMQVRSRSDGVLVTLMVREDNVIAGPRLEHVALDRDVAELIAEKMREFF